MGDSGGVWGVPDARLPAAYAATGRRAVRVTLVAAAGFYPFRYGFDRPVAATYALFTVVALGGLSRIPGTGRQRAAFMARLLPVCWALVAVGTCLSVRTWSAVLGMLVVGFTLAFSAVGGPRPAGAAPGPAPALHPAVLPRRTTPVRSATGCSGRPRAWPSSSRPRRCSSRARPAVVPGAGRPRGAGRRAVRGAARRSPRCPWAGPDLRAAQGASQALRSLSVPEAERPAGPGVRERALTHTGLALRTLLGRLAQLPSGRGDGTAADVTAVLRAVAGPGRGHRGLSAGGDVARAPAGGADRGPRPPVRRVRGPSCRRCRCRCRCRC
ncbi:hypothetical protein LT493_16250 [Streptomyces tricolor]|nr:hypothetical protein [Streptomyces tricolor]